MFFALLSRLFRTTTPVPRPARPADVDSDDEPVRACGWFDSSHELRCGLLVTEHARADAVANELPLADWLELHLAGRCAPDLG